MMCRGINLFDDAPVPYPAGGPGTARDAYVGDGWNERRAVKRIWVDNPTFVPMLSLLHELLRIAQHDLRLAPEQLDLAGDAHLLALQASLGRPELRTVGCED